MSFPRYPTYKDSGVEWLGEVPGHWRVSRLGRQFRARSGTDEKSDDGSFPLYGANGVIGLSDNASLPSGTVLVGRVGSAGSVTRTSERCAVSDNALVLTPNNGLFDTFLYYLVASLDLSALISNTAQPLLTGTLLLAQRAVFPPVGEQAHIAAFLDRETAKIDALVAEQQRLIALLKEKRQAVVSHAVTKGLNPDAPMKDSGIEWLGEVPVHWSVSKLKRLCTLISKGTTPTTIGAEFTSEGVRFLKAENVTEDGVSGFPEFYVSEDTHAKLSRSELFADDVLVVIAGATTGKSAVLQSSLCPANTNQAVSFLRPRDKQNSAWINLWLGTSSVRNVILLTSVQSAQPNLSMEDLGNIPVPVPPRSELENLLETVGNHARGFDLLTTEAQRAIDLLQERRTALISAAVTGQIDVRPAAERAA